jgi:hypothetical protein
MGEGLPRQGDMGGGASHAGGSRGVVPPDWQGHRGVIPPGGEETEARLGQGSRHLRRLRSINEDGPRGRWRWPKRARGGRPAGSEPAFRSPGLPRDEARLSRDWAATPQASLSHM